MFKAIVMRWLPWSWKSLWSSQKEWYKIISRDILRIENPDMKEKDIIELQNNMIKECNCNIIIDSTNMNPNTLEKIKNLCIESWYDTEVKDMFFEMHKALNNNNLDKYRKECKYRNINREKRVPESVIDRMFLQNYEIYNPYWKWVVIVDIDWTLANVNHRLHHLEWKKDWKLFFNDMVYDTVYEPVKTVVNMLSETHPIVVMSWRPDSYWFETEQWLKDNWIKYNYLLMRSAWDWRTDVEVKRSLHSLIKQDVAFAFDDRACIIKLRESMWIYVFNCSDRENNDF